MTESMQRFAGQVVIVTGASKGIGQATAVAFGREGARVGVNYFSDAAGAREAAARGQGGGGGAGGEVNSFPAAAGAREPAARVQAGGGQALLVQADVSQPADVERMV